MSLLHDVDRNIGSSVRVLATGSRSSVWPILQGVALNRFHLQKFQLLQTDYYSLHIAFAEWVIHKVRTTNNFPVLLCSMLMQILHVKNCSMFTLADRRQLTCTRPQAAQQHFTVNVWAKIVSDSLFEPYVLPPRSLDARNYHIFLQDVLSGMLDAVLAYFDSESGLSMMRHNYIT